MVVCLERVGELEKRFFFLYRFLEDGWWVVGCWACWAGEGSGVETVGYG